VERGSLRSSRASGIMSLSEDLKIKCSIVHSGTFWGSENTVLEMK